MTTAPFIERPGQSFTAGMSLTLSGTPAIDTWYSMPLTPMGAMPVVDLALSNTHMIGGLIVVPFIVSFSKAIIYSWVPGTSLAKFGLYTKQGDKIMEFSGLCDLWGSPKEFSLVASLPPGLYWLWACDDGSGTHPQIDVWPTQNTPLFTSSLPAGEFAVEGTVPIAGGVLPASFDPLLVVGANSKTPVLRFDV